MDARDVSVVMAVRDGERYVAEAITSLLGQHPAPGQVVVVDDGSSDATPDVLASFGDRVAAVRQPRRGSAAAINTGVARATGSVLAFLDADDLWPSDSLAVRLARLEQHDGVDAVYGRTIQFLSPDCHDPGRRRFDPGPLSVEVLGALVVRRRAFDAVGRLDETLVVAAGIAWVLRSRRMGLTSVAIDEVVLRRRIHGANSGALTQAGKAANLLRVVRAHHKARAPAGVDPTP